MADLVVATNGNVYARIILDKLLATDKHRIRGVVIVHGDYGGYCGIHALFRLARVTTVPYLVYKLFVFGLFKVVRRISKRDWEVKDVVQRHNIPYMCTPKINTEEVALFMKRKSPDVLISVSCPQRIRKKLLKIPKLGAVNIHSSLLPAYAGLAPYFWVLARGELSTGTTIHYMTDQFDEGKILQRQSCEIPAGVSAFALFHHLAVLGRDLLPEAIDLVIGGEIGIKQDISKSTYYSHPDWKSYCRMRRYGFRLLRLRDLVQMFGKSTPHGFNKCNDMRHRAHLETAA